MERKNDVLGRSPSPLPFILFNSTKDNPSSLTTESTSSLSSSSSSSSSTSDFLIPELNIVKEHSNVHNNQLLSVSPTKAQPPQPFDFFQDLDQPSSSTSSITLPLQPSSTPASPFLLIPVPFSFPSSSSSSSSSTTTSLLLLTPTPAAATTTTITRAVSPSLPSTKTNVELLDTLIVPSKNEASTETDELALIFGSSSNVVSQP